MHGLVGQILIGVEAENPIAGEGEIVDGPVELDGVEAGPGVFDDGGAEGSGDGLGVVGGAGVDDEDFGGDGANALDAAANVELFVAGEDDD